MKQIAQEDYLMHFGVLGQKWGKRRYQNPDGSLTELGRQHYGRRMQQAVYARNQAVRTKATIRSRMPFNIGLGAAVGTLASPVIGTASGAISGLIATPIQYGLNHLYRKYGDYKINKIKTISKGTIKPENLISEPIKR